VLLSDVDGFYSANPKTNPTAHRYDVIDDITPEIEAMAGDPVSGLSKGGMKTSEELSASIYSWLDRGGSRLTFVIGGAEGLPLELKYVTTIKSSRENGSAVGSEFPMLSLSPLTFTHQMARTLLMEQIYRASEIRKGTGYHK
jgi:rRNA large subunit m3Psi methyltransferase RlmH